MAVDLSNALYAAIKDASFASDLATYQSEPAVFTRRPTPADCGFPLILAAGDISYGDEDFINDELAVVVRDVAVYGQKQVDYRAVETIGYAVRDLFHRQRDSLSISGWNVVDVRCSGPVEAPTDDDAEIGRIVSVRVRLTR